MKTLLMMTILTLSTVSFARDSFRAERIAERRAAQIEDQIVGNSFENRTDAYLKCDRNEVKKCC